MGENITKSFIPLLLGILLLLSGCSNGGAATIIEMEMTDRYDASDPFVNEKLFYVSENIDTLKLNVEFVMKGESGVLEIADNETQEVIWSDRWDKNVDKTKFTISLDTLDKEKEYVVRFTGTQIEAAEIVIASDSKLIKERERPLKPNKG